jgi:hypothetical protein
VTTDDSQGSLHSRRRVLRTATATVVGAGVMAGGGAALLRTLNGGDGGGGRLLLQADAQSGVGSLERPLTELGLVKVGTGKWATPQLSTSLVTMAGLTWTASRGDVRLQMRFKSKDGWTAWQTASPLGDGPDPGSGEGGRFGTAPLIIDPSDALQVRVTGTALPKDLRLALIHSEPTAKDEMIVAGRQAAGAARAGAAVGQPAILTRAQWGANESWRSGSPTIDTTIVQTHIHHSASSNGYAASAVPALIRSFYKYHTQSLGWSDIGYNFLVDSFGQIWEGRYGGITVPVRGAHTLGFNTNSAGFCVIGNLELVQPTSATISSLSALAAWKLGLYGRDPQGWASVTSSGSDKYKSGRVVNLPVIDGHRDTNDTACPGSNLYAQLAAIRAGAAGTITASNLKLKKPFAVTGDPVVGSTLTVGDGQFKPQRAAVAYQWTRNGGAIPGANASTYVVTDADIAQSIGVVVTGTLAGAAPVTSTADASGPVRTWPTFAIRTQRKPGGKGIIHVEVTAPGAPLVDGQMTIRVGRRFRTVQLKRGKAIGRFVGLKAGRYRVRAEYAGGTYIQPGKGKAKIRIPASRGA